MEKTRLTFYSHAFFRRWKFSHSRSSLGGLKIWRGKWFGSVVGIGSARVGSVCLAYCIISNANQCEEGVKVLSRIIFYLLLEKLVSRLRTPRSRTAARWKKLLTGNYVIIQVYFTSHNISTYIYLSMDAVGKMRTGDTGCVCARAKSCLSCRKLRVRFYFVSIYSSKRIL